MHGQTYIKLAVIHSLDRAYFVDVQKVVTVTLILCMPRVLVLLCTEIKLNTIM